MFQFQKQPIDNRRLGKANIQHFKIIWKLKLHNANGRAESAVRLYSTLNG